MGSRKSLDWCCQRATRDLMEKCLYSIGAKIYRGSEAHEPANSTRTLKEKSSEKLLTYRLNASISSLSFTNQVRSSYPQPFLFNITHGLAA